MAPGRGFTISLLAEQETELEGFVVTLAGSLAELLLARPVPGGAILKLECEDMLLLGEVSYAAAAPGGYAVRVRLEHSLVSTQELGRLARQLRGDSSLSADSPETLKDRDQQNRQ